MDACYSRSPDVASRVVDGEAVLVKMSEGMLHVLNASASRIWVRADGVRRGSDLARGLDAPASRAFLARMTELGLLERSPSPRAEADAFPQEVDPPASSDPPAIRASEPVETLASGTCNSDSVSFCSIIKY